MVAKMAVKVWVVGSYNSAELKAMLELPPPAKRILPAGSEIALKSERRDVIVAARAVKVWVAGSNTSALLSATELLSNPPSSSTRPSGSSAAA